MHDGHPSGTYRSGPPAPAGWMWACPSPASCSPAPPRSCSTTTSTAGCARRRSSTSPPRSGTSCPPVTPTRCAGGSRTPPTRGSLERYLETFDHTVAVMQTADAPAPGRPRVRARPRRRRRGVRRGPLRPRAAPRSGGLSSSRSSRRCATGSPRARRRPRRDGTPDRRTPAAHRDAAPGPQPGDRRADGGLPRPGRRRLRHRRAPRPATRPPGTSTRSSTSSARTRTSPSTPARRSGCRRSGRRSSGAAPTGSGTASGSSTTSRSADDGAPTLGRLAAYVRDKRIPLEMCPSSNIQTGAAASIAEHPIGAADRAALPGHGQHRQPADERHLDDPRDGQLVDAFGYGMDDLRWFTINAMKSAFLPVRRAAGDHRRADQAGVRRAGRDELTRRGTAAQEAPGPRPDLTAERGSLLSAGACGRVAAPAAGSGQACRPWMSSRCSAGAVGSATPARWSRTPPGGGWPPPCAGGWWSGTPGALRPAHGGRGSAGGRPAERRDHRAQRGGRARVGAEVAAAAAHRDSPREAPGQPERRVGVDLRWRDLDPDDVWGRLLRPGPAVIDCARTLPFDEALAVADSALRHGHVTPERLRSLAEQVRTTGRAACLRVAGEADGLAANPFESVLRATSLDVAGLRLRPQVVTTRTAGPVARTSSTPRAGWWSRQTRSSSTAAVGGWCVTASATTRWCCAAGRCCGSRGST